MKFNVVSACAMLFLSLLSFSLHAGKLQEYRGEADQYHQAQDYKKAYKIYFKLAKIGDHYSQDKISSMYLNGEGKKPDLATAYAWAVLAAEGGKEEMAIKRDELLEQASDKPKAQKTAEKLKKKYGKLALEKKAAKREEMTGGGACTNSRIGCS